MPYTILCFTVLYYTTNNCIPGLDFSLQLCVVVFFHRSVAECWRRCLEVFAPLAAVLVDEKPVTCALQYSTSSSVAYKVFITAMFSLPAEHYRILSSASLCSSESCQSNFYGSPLLLCGSQKHIAVTTFMKSLSREITKEPRWKKPKCLLFPLLSLLVSPLLNLVYFRRLCSNVFML